MGPAAIEIIWNGDGELIFDVRAPWDFSEVCVDRQRVEGGSSNGEKGNGIFVSPRGKGKQYQPFIMYNMLDQRLIYIDEPQIP